MAVLVVVLVVVGKLSVVSGLEVINLLLGNESSLGSTSATLALAVAALVTATASDTTLARALLIAGHV
jgi:hypothetical protein